MAAYAGPAISSVYINETGVAPTADQLAAWQSNFAAGSTLTDLTQAVAAYAGPAISSVYINETGVAPTADQLSAWQSNFEIGGNLTELEQGIAASSQAGISSIYETLTGNQLNGDFLSQLQNLLGSDGTTNSTAATELESTPVITLIGEEVGQSGPNFSSTADIANAYQVDLLNTLSSSPSTWQSISNSLISTGINLITSLNPISTAEAAQRYPTVNRQQAETLLTNPQVQAFLNVIQDAEGGQPNETYNHVPISQGSFPIGYGINTASGSYAITAGSWGNYGRFLDGTSASNFFATADFSAHTQQLVAVEMMSMNGVITPLLSGNFNAALTAAAGSNGMLWAALPGGTQPHSDYNHLLSVFTSSGGQVSQ